MNELLYSGKAKDVYRTKESHILKLVYKDQATALNGKRKELIPNKGKINLAISTLIFKYLNTEGIPTHLVETISDTQQLVHEVTIIPLEIVVRNYAAGSFAKKFEIENGKELINPIIECYFKNDRLDDPFINDNQIEALTLVKMDELAFIKEMALKINTLLKRLFSDCQLDLIDFKVEFGKDQYGNIILADEFSPDNCRLWQKNTLKSFDKDIFRKNQGDLIQAYQVVLDKLRMVLEEKTCI